MAQDSILNQAQNYLSQGRVENAYDILSGMADENIGIPQFDYLYGSALLEKKQYTLALFALERALMVQPDDVNTQAALARCYHALKEFEQANALIKKINQLEASSLPKDALKHLQSIKQKPKQKSTINGFVRGTWGHDSNLTNGPDDNFMILPAVQHLGSIYIGDSLVKDSDPFLTVDAALQYYTPLGQRFAYKVGMQGSQRGNDQRHDEDIGVVSSWLGGEYKKGTQSFHLTLKYQKLWLDNELYRDQIGFISLWNNRVGTNKAISFYLNAYTNDYPDSSDSNAKTYSLGGVYNHQFSARFSPVFSSQIYVGQENLDLDTNSYQGYDQAGLLVSNQLQISKKNSVMLQVGYELRQYQAENPFFLVTRDDESYTATIQLSHHFKAKKFIVSLQGNAFLNQSNIALYDYLRSTGSINFQWKF